MLLFQLRKSKDGKPKDFKKQNEFIVYNDSGSYTWEGGPLKNTEDKALYIDGGYHWLIFTNVSDKLDKLDTEWSIIFWVKITAFKGDPSIFSSALEGYGREIYMGLLPNQFVFKMENYSFSRYINVGVDFTKWNLVELNFKNGKFNYFINGNLIGSDTISSNTCKLFDKNRPNNFEIFNYYQGRERYNDGPCGYLYKFSIYDKALHYENYNPLTVFPEYNCIYSNIKIS